MLVVVASRWDGGAAELVAAWSAHGAAVLSPRDLSRPGIAHRTGRDDTIVVAGVVVPTRAIRGIVTRIPAVDPEELGHVDQQDRTYVAAEMTAFLAAWLASLPCPVLPAPTPRCLLGPLVHQEAWIRLAHAAGVAVRPLRRSVPAREDLHDEVTPVTVIGDLAFGGQAIQREAALAVAREARAGLCEVAVTRDGAVAGGRPWPAVMPPAVSDALARWLLR